MSEREDKSRRLASILTDLGSVVVAYSGGVDSAYLASAAHETLGPRALAVTAVSPSLARRELAEASRLARSRGWAHLAVDTAELARPEYARNAPDRCYWCKVELIDVLEPIARRRGAEIAIGTNVDDLGDIRPGVRAARERGARAPLLEAGLTKADVRALSAAAGLPTAEKPSSPCLASRIAYGVPVTEQRLNRVEAAEDALRALGFDVLRVRDHGDLARVEVPAPDVPRAAALGSEIAKALSRLGFRYVTLDLNGFRSGSMNEVLSPPRLAR